MIVERINFVTKSEEEKMYYRIVNMLLEKGYKPLYNNITYHYSFDCKNTTISNDPYSITINYKPAA